MGRICGNDSIQLWWFNTGGTQMVSWFEYSSSGVLSLASGRTNQGRNLYLDTWESITRCVFWLFAITMHRVFKGHLSPMTSLVELIPRHSGHYWNRKIEYFELLCSWKQLFLKQNEFLFRNWFASITRNHASLGAQVSLKLMLRPFCINGYDQF